MLLLSTVIGTYFVNKGRANPWFWKKEREVPAPKGTDSREISITSPKNRTYSTNNISLAIETGSPIPVDSYHGSKAYYKASWLPNEIHPDTYFIYGYVNLTNVPEGSHSLEFIHIDEHILKKRELGTVVYYTSYKTISTATVNFAIDTIPPNVSVLSFENKMFNVSDVVLDFSVSEPVLKISYVLDSFENVTITGNTTLRNLSYGEHSVTVFAMDEAGNFGVSETLFFTIEESPEPEFFPTTMVIAPIAVVSVIGSSLLVYFKKRKG